MTARRGDGKTGRQVDRKNIVAAVPCAGRWLNAATQERREATTRRRLWRRLVGETAREQVESDRIG